MLSKVDADADAASDPDASDADVDAVTHISNTRSYTRRSVPSSLGQSLFFSQLFSSFL